MSETFEVYARKEEEEPLKHIGTIEVEGDDLAGAVEKEYGGDWLELVAIPGTSIGWAIGGDDS